MPDGFSLVSGFSDGSLEPGDTATFVVELDADAPGNYSGQVSFTSDDPDEGTFNFTVTGAVLNVDVVDNGDAEFSKSGDWNTATGQGAYGDLEYVYIAPWVASSQAAWTFDVEPGQYRVMTSYLHGAPYATDAPFTIYEDTGEMSQVGGADIDQTAEPDDLFAQDVWWEEIDVVTITTGTLRVKLTNDADAYVIADAVRIERIDIDPPAPEAPLRAEERFDYDQRGNQSFHSDELGRVTRTFFDDLDRVVRIERPDPDGVGPLPSPVMVYTLDAAGNVLAEEDVEGTVTEYAYTPQGWVSQVE